MASQETPNYRLSRWAGTDRILVEEFNDNWDKIDAALKSNADGVAALQTALASAGNCKIETSTYTGNGKNGNANRTTLTFDKMPLLVFVGGYDGQHMCLFQGYSAARITFASASYSNTVSWGENSVSWYSTQDAEIQFNKKSTTYYVVALFAA